VRRPLSSIALVLCLALPAYGAAFSSSSHTSGSHANKPPSSKPSTTTPATGSSQVHVSGYYRKDGTYVPAHDRKAPAEGSAHATGSAPHTTPPDSSTSHSSTPHPGPSHSSTGAGTHGCKTCPRDAHGRILRSEKAKVDFMKKTGYPHGRPGYVVDHIVPLECGGADVPGNMQWQTVAEAKAKDRTEGNCRK
jgi:hypothetical protein